MISHEQIQAALSARMDGESTGLDDAIVDAHLEQCAECQAFLNELSSLGADFDLGEIALAPPPDLSEAILAGVESEWQRFSSRRLLVLSLCRVFLGAMAALWVAWAIVLLVSGSAPEEAAVRFGVALGLGFTAWKPQQIPGVLLIVGTMFTFTVGFGVRDLLLDTGGSIAAPLALMALTFVALVATWAADRGADIRSAWRLLSADPA